MRIHHRRTGVTLIELLVVIVILGIAAGVAGLAMGTARATAEDGADWHHQVTQARSRAIASGSPVRVLLEFSSPTGDSLEMHWITALPDGSVLAPPAADVARLTGRSVRERAQ